MDIFLGRGEDRYGPFSEDDIKQLLTDGELDGTELAWHEGRDEWANVRDVIKEIPSFPVIAARHEKEAEEDRRIDEAERIRASVKRRTIRKFKLPGYLFFLGGIIYGLTAQANHFGYSWYGWKPADVTFSDQWLGTFQGQRNQ